MTVFRRMRRPEGWAAQITLFLVVVGTLGGSAPALAADPPSLARARQLYNQQRYAEAIEAAVEARRIAGFSDVSDMVIGRARLGRFREAGSADDLAAAHDALRVVRPDRLSSRDRLELIVGLGECLFHEDAFGSAAELFESALVRAHELGPKARERLIDWWAGALDREAQALPVEDRGEIYVRVVRFAEDELRRDAGAASAAYWLAAGSRAVGDLERAWEAARAGWLRASFSVDHGAALRTDLDRLVNEAIIPERARRLAGPDFNQSVDALRLEWDAFKAAWGPR